MLKRFLSILTVSLTFNATYAVASNWSFDTGVNLGYSHVTKPVTQYVVPAPPPPVVLAGVVTDHTRGDGVNMDLTSIGADLRVRYNIKNLIGSYNLPVFAGVQGNVNIIENDDRVLNIDNFVNPAGIDTFIDYEEKGSVLVLVGITPYSYEDLLDINTYVGYNTTFMNHNVISNENGVIFNVLEDETIEGAVFALEFDVSSRLFTGNTRVKTDHVFSTSVPDLRFRIGASLELSNQHRIRVINGNGTRHSAEIDGDEIFRIYVGTALRF